MKKLLNITISVCLLSSILFIITACGKDSDNSPKTTPEDTGSYTGVLSLSGEGIKVDITKADKSGNDFFDISFNVKSIEKPVQEYARKVTFSISTTSGTLFKDEVTIPYNQITDGVTYVGRSLIRIDSKQQLDKKSLKIVSITKD